MENPTENDRKPDNRAGCAVADLFGSVLLIVEAEVRYWEDATVNGAEDTEGTLIPRREGDTWKPVIELATGQIRDWPQGTTADIHYKVCDAGEYWLADADGRKRWKWKGHYVPDRLLCVGDKGCGDYIIFKVGASGIIEGWQAPDLAAEDWNSEPNVEISHDRERKI